ncbi:MAG: NFACT RNA binding domain-containing protein [Parachlamydia sp.]|nr:NFACT RNA binding domain-containing protein [Parachlamydia sp.]
MSLTKVQVAALVAELQSLQGSKISSIQSIAPRTFVFQVDGHRLLLCLQQPFLRFHLSSQHYPEHETSFTKALSEALCVALGHSRIVSIRQLNDDRILEINANSYRLIAELFPKRPNLYLIDSQQQILLALNPVSETLYSLPPQPPFQIEKTSQPLSSQEIERFYAAQEMAAELQQEKQKLQKHVQQRLKRNIKTEQACQNDLQRGLHWKDAQHEAELLQANFFRLKRGLNEIEVLDWEKQDMPRTISLDRTKEPKDEVARRFKQSKKLHLSIEPLQRQIKVIRNERVRLERDLEWIVSATSLDALSSIAKEVRLPGAALEKEREKARRLPYREFLTASGLKIWAGKDARSNEKLTFSHAKGSDWWLHVHNFPGSHVILRVSKQQQPDDESIQDAIQIALAYSSAKEQAAAEVCVTQVKYVSRLGRGKEGKVQISKHKIMQVRFDPERFRQIKQRGQA